MFFFRSLAGISAWVNPLFAQLVIDETFPPQKIMFWGFVIGMMSSLVILSYFNRVEYAATVNFLQRISYMDHIQIIKLTGVTLLLLSISTSAGVFVWVISWPSIPLRWGLLAGMLACTVTFHGVLALTRQRVF